MSDSTTTDEAFEITVFVSTTEDDCESTDTISLREFLEANADGMDDKERSDLLMHLARGEIYKGGGGASVAYTVELADPVEHDRAMCGHDEMLSALKRFLASTEADFKRAPDMTVRTAYETNGQARAEARAAIAIGEGRA